MMKANFISLLFFSVLSSLLICCRTTNDPNHHTFEKDWNSFNCPNWSIKFIDDSSDYLEKPTEGRLQFINQIDTTLTLTYFVFRKSILDEDFEKRKIHWNIIQSCVTVTNGKSPFTDFDFNGNYYLLKPCYNCNVGTSKECELLALKLKTTLHN